MKVRNGFVSNSSSSSFILYGIMKEGENYEKMCKQIYGQIFGGNIKMMVILM